jgi:GABA permease
MRNPVRTEAEAFSFTLVVAGLALAIAIAAWLGGPWVGFGVFVGLALGVLAGIFLRSEPKVREPAVWERHRIDEKRHILVIANETCAARELCMEIRYRAQPSDAEVLVVAPALSSHVRYWTSDVDHAREAAQRRLDASLAALAAAGVRARGEVGDADPIQAIEDALRTFGADEVILSTHPPGRSNWLERDVVARARERFELPITHVVVDLEHEAVPVNTG